MVDIHYNFCAITKNVRWSSPSAPTQFIMPEIKAPVLICIINLKTYSALPRRWGSMGRPVGSALNSRVVRGVGAPWTLLCSNFDNEFESIIWCISVELSLR